MATSIGATAIDVQSIVTGLMSVERQPLTALNTKEASYKAMLSAYGTIKSDLSALQSAAAALKLQSAFSVFKATAADTTLLGASADSTAVAGSYTVAINNRASAQTIVSANQASSTTAITNAGIPNGATTLDITVGAGATVQVSIAANSTLEQIRDAINLANTGVNATIVNNGAGYNLVYSAKDTGVANTISATSADGTLEAIAGSASMNQTSAAANASLTVNGVPVSSATNTVAGAIQGVTLNLTKDSGTTTVTVARDTSTIEATVNKFISAYNQLNNDIKFTHTKGSQLQSDSTVVSVQNQLNRILSTATGFSATGGYDYLAQVGISRGSDGNLTLDTATFESKLSSNQNGVVQLFTDASKGVATSVYNQAYNMIGVKGLVTSRTDGLNSSILDIEKKIDAFNVRLDMIQQRYTKQFTALNTMVTNMQQTSSFLSKQLGA